MSDASGPELPDSPSMTRHVANLASVGTFTFGSINRLGNDEQDAHMLDDLGESKGDSAFDKQQFNDFMPDNGKDALIPKFTAEEIAKRVKAAKEGMNQEIDNYLTKQHVAKDLDKITNMSLCTKEDIKLSVGELRHSFLAGWKAAEKTFNGGVPLCSQQHRASERKWGAPGPINRADGASSYTKRCPPGFVWLPRRQVELAAKHGLQSNALSDLHKWQKWVETKVVKEPILATEQQQGVCVDARLASMVVIRGECSSNLGCECSDGRYHSMINRHERPMLGAWNALFYALNKGRKFACFNCGKNSTDAPLTCPEAKPEATQKPTAAENVLGESWSIMKDWAPDKTISKVTKAVAQARAEARKVHKKLAGGDIFDKVMAVLLKGKQFQEDHELRDVLKALLRGFFSDGLKGVSKGYNFVAAKYPNVFMTLWQWGFGKFLNLYGEKVGWNPRALGALCENQVFEQFVSESSPTYLAANLTANKTFERGVSTFYLHKAPLDWWRAAATGITSAGVPVCAPMPGMHYKLKEYMTRPGYSNGCVKSIPRYDSNGTAYWPTNMSDFPAGIRQEEKETLVGSFDLSKRRESFKKMETLPMGPPTCSARIDLQMDSCTTCCCRKGMFQVRVETKLVAGHADKCGGWYFFFDSLVRQLASAWRMQTAYKNHLSVCFSREYNEPDGQTGLASLYPNRITTPASKPEPVYPRQKGIPKTAGSNDFIKRWDDDQATVPGQAIEGFFQTLFSNTIGEDMNKSRK